MDIIPFGWDPFSGQNFPAFPSFFAGGLPKVDVRETTKEVVIVADIPGFDPHKVHVEVDGQNLRISAASDEEKESKGKDFYRKERSTHSFSRVIPLPSPIMESGAKAVSKNGILTVTLMKKNQEGVKGKKIPVEEA